MKLQEQFLQTRRPLLQPYHTAGCDKGQGNRLF